jgi:hypothetical protein
VRRALDGRTVERERFILGPRRTTGRPGNNTSAARPACYLDIPHPVQRWCWSTPLLPAWYPSILLLCAAGYEV